MSGYRHMGVLAALAAAVGLPRAPGFLDDASLPNGFRTFERKTGRRLRGHFAYGRPRTRRSTPVITDSSRRSAFRIAALKYDGVINPRPCDGVKESRRDLERRLNWLRERLEEASHG